MKDITLHSASPYGYSVVHDDGSDLSFYEDWGFPSLAATFGWKGFKKYQGDASQQIAKATEWLDNHIGVKAEDPGYF